MLGVPCLPGEPGSGLVKVGTLSVVPISAGGVLSHVASIQSCPPQPQVLRKTPYLWPAWAVDCHLRPTQPCN